MSFSSHAQVITTIAGGGTSGLGDGGPAISCELNFPYSTAVDASGNLYIADAHNNRIRKVNTSGIITTIAGNGIAGFSGDDSAATNAELNEPVDVAVDASGNVYIADNSNHRIRMVNTSGIITTIAGTGAIGYNGDEITATTATLYSPHGIAIDGSGNLLICDDLNNRIRKVSPATGGIITTIAGNGTGGYIGDGASATAEEIYRPYGIAIDAVGNIYIADLNNRIRKVDLSGIITTIAGTGVAGYNGDDIIATAAEINQPFGVAVDGVNNIYIADVFNNRIRKVSIDGIITTYAGTETNGFSGDGGSATAAELFNPVGVTVDNADNVFITDGGNFRIRYISSVLSVNTINTTIENVEIYPNPSFNRNFTVNIISSSDIQVQIIIIDVVGEKIKEITSTTNKQLTISLDIPDGIYFLSAVTVNGKVTKKVIIQG